jgi:hypothetical protein
MKNPEWMTSLPFRVVCQRGMTKEYLKRFKTGLLILAMAVAKNKISLRTVRLHFHGDGTHCPWHGESAHWVQYITLCSADTETALHELAHVWADQGHSKKWARLLFRLHRQFTTPIQCQRWDLDVARAYPTVATKYYERRYHRLPSQKRKRQIVETPDV